MRSNSRIAGSVQASPAAEVNVTTLLRSRSTFGVGLNRMSDIPRTFLHQKQNQLQEMVYNPGANSQDQSKAVVALSRRRQQLQQQNLRQLMADLRATHQIKRLERAWLVDMRSTACFSRPPPPGGLQLPLYLQHFAKRCMPDAGVSLSPSMLLRSFIAQGGVQLLRQILVYDTLDSNAVVLERPDTELSQLLRSKGQLIDLLCRLIVHRSQGDQHLGLAVLDSLISGTGGDHLVNYLFTCTGVSFLYGGSIQLLEDVFQHTNGLFMLNRVPKLEALVQRFTDDQLVQFTRILTLALSDGDQGADRPGGLLQAQLRQPGNQQLHADRRPMPNSGSICSNGNPRDSNLDCLLACPQFLPRMVQLMKYMTLRCIPRYRGQPTESENWLTWIDRALDNAIIAGSQPPGAPLPPPPIWDSPALQGEDEVFGGFGRPPAPANQMPVSLFDRPLSFALHRCSQLHNLVSLCYVLGLLLGGRQRRRVQRRLAELRFAPALQDLFDMFLWRCHTAGSASTAAEAAAAMFGAPPVQLQQMELQRQRELVRQQQREHQHQLCECAPEVAVKIQLLRLIHSFCDHANWSHRRLLLCQSELAELRCINASLPAPDRVDGLTSVDRSLMCRKEPGLLVRMVEVLQHEPSTSTFRFWLARAVESYLRCQGAYCDQVLLIRRGLLSHVASTLIEVDSPSREVVQSGFDLLAELLKFNEQAVRELDGQLGEAGSNRLCQLASANLVDSNMFLRSAMLSIDHFARITPATAIWCNRESCLLARWANDDAKATVSYRMLRLLCLSSLTQENVSCLNTGLVVLVYAHRASKLPAYLAAIKRMDTLDERQLVFPHLSRGDCSSLKPIMANLLDLLAFWSDHYLNKERDSNALEKSSRIVFDEWKVIVATLSSRDATQDTSVAYYLSNR
ncbi:hypothetical protein BOX15_Mlig011780g2 [Macrostomum lignano]|uniref:Uncharacterized protein n=2 Tax=Macrostomum lignano TaxID=282301 RepID=A0A267GXJ8_9PLAT|nr:hypothetical protein BOX15_Mlig011780g2 [Macrostomum lignano]